MESPQDPNAPGANVAELLIAARRYARLFVVAPLAIALVAGLASYLVPRTYRAAALFLPEKSATPGMSSALAGVAGQFGIELGGEGSAPTRLYAELARSRRLLEVLLSTPVRTLDGQERLLLDVVVPGDEEEAAERRDLAIRKLGRAINTRTDIQTGVVRVTLEARDPGVAAQALDSLVSAMSRFNLESRQTRGRQRREFAERRAAEALSDLQRAEAAMREMMETNRSLESPRLQYERARLQRQIDIHQQVYLTLARELETARIEEVNDIPVITVIDRPVPPLRSAGPRRVFIVVSAWALGLVLAAAVAAIGENLRRRGAAGDPEAASLWSRLSRRLSRLGLLHVVA